jgi:signal peptidase II
MKKYQFFYLAFFLIFLDQFIKLLVHYNMPLYSEISLVGNFIKLHHIENPGMAFGINFDFKYTKLILTLFRLFASVAIGMYLKYIIVKNVNKTFILSTTMIFSGAVGNVIDSVFYGILLNNAHKNAPFELFNGQVIDMFFIDIWEGYLPSYIPFLGDSFISLWPVFNVADSLIFIGVFILIIFQKTFFNSNKY